MKVAVVQLDSKFGKVADNRDRALQRMAAVPADLYVLPELFTSGYSFAAEREVRDSAEPAGSGDTYAAISDFAHSRNAWVVYGFPEVVEPPFDSSNALSSAPRFHNSANLVGPGGLVGTYRKGHLFARETLFFSQGAEPPPVFDLPVGRVGLMICFDWYFPEVARSLALRGAQIIAHPSNLVLPHCPSAMITRSLENRVFSVTCDRVGRERNGSVGYDFIGTSQVISPLGEVLLRLSSDAEECVAVEIEPSWADSKAVTEFNDLFRDRRTDLYGI